MNRAAVVIFFCAIAILGAAATSARGQDKPRRSFLAVLKEGQSVSVKENGGRFEITVADESLGTRGHKVTEVGPDCVVIEDIAGVTERRIPVYSITSIVKVKIPRQK